VIRITDGADQALRTSEEAMPLWKIHHPAGEYSDADKKAFSEAITRVYEAVPIPRFYVVVIFEGVSPDDMYVGGETHGTFVRIQIDQMARTLPGPVIREWWVRNLDEVIAPWVRDRGYDWEFTVTEPPFDLWSLQGQIPPPFESVAERRWVQENKATPYGQAEKLPVNLSLTPGTIGE
jgi:phenylpyruvate tautomerase PptA (4-oxalocrotonate tautomerase family)